jgi:hypothetical protein
LVRVAIIVAAWGATVLGGCDRDPDALQFARPDQGVVPDIVARVGDRSIGASEVASRMTADNLDAESAIEALLREEALAQEAERSGVTASLEDQRSIERLMVRTMLHDLEALNMPDSVSDEDVREAFAVNAHAFQAPGKTRTLADAEAELRQAISQQRRLSAIVAIVQALEAKGLVHYDETGVQRLLSMPGLPRRAK